MNAFFKLCSAALILLFSLGSIAQETTANTVILHTTKGPITIQLNPEKAPITVANFLDYAKSGFYDGTIFHRVMKRFMIQGGGFVIEGGGEDIELIRKETKDPIINESKNGLHNDRWTIAMARTDEPDSATAQFFINTRMNSQLDRLGKRAGYAVFGEVTDGFYVVQAIEKVAVQPFGGHGHVPIEPIIIERVEIL